MENLYLDYLSLLDELSSALDQLSQLANQKTAAVRKDDLMALDGVLKQEQALSLSLRGQEQRRLKLLRQLGLAHTPLSKLAGQYPAGLQLRAKQTVERLRHSYDIYQCAAQVARNTLECNLHELEKIVTGLGVPPSEGAGYIPPEVEPPKKMKTDFRA